jgi:hypothetical protein
MIVLILLCAVFLLAFGVGILLFPNPIRTQLAKWYWRWQWKTGRIHFTMENWRKDL